MEEDLLELESMAPQTAGIDHYPFDNYNPLAMQYYALIYSVYRREKDPERAGRFTERAKLLRSSISTSSPKKVRSFLTDASRIASR